MTKLTEIEALAEDAIQYEQANPDCDDGIRKRLDYLADKLDPQTVKAMCQLIRQMGEALLECRSSVKFDLLTYEKQAIAYGRIGAEGKEIHAAAESEANRLQKLIDRLDALAAYEEMK